MKTKVLSLAALAALLASCASTPVAEVAPGPPPETLRTWAVFLRAEHESPEAAEDPALREALAAVEKGSPDSLAACAKRLTDAGLLQTAGGLQAAALARAVSALLYPGSPDGLPKDLPAYEGRYHAILSILSAGKPVDWIPLAAGDDFLTLVLPAFTLLSPSSPVTDRLLQRLEENLARADGLNAASVLPPYLRGLAAERKQKPDTQAALSFYKESAKRDASFQLAYRRLAELSAGKGSPAGEAIPYIDALLRKAPEDLALLKKLAAAALAAGETEKALDATGRAILLAPEDVDLILLRASVFEAQGNWYQALRIADILMKQMPGEPRAHLLKARLLYERQGDLQEAIRIIDAAEPAFPDDAGFPELKGRILLETGRGEEGLKSLERALALEPTRLSTVRLLLQDAIRMRRWLQATLYLAEILDRNVTAEDLAMAYQVSANLGDHEQALLYAEQLSRAREGTGPVILMIRSQIATGRTADAVGNIARLLAGSSDPALRSELLYLKALTDREDKEAQLRDLRSSLLEEPDNLEALLAIADAFTRRADYRLALIYLRRAVQLRPDDVGLALQLSALEKQVDQKE